jgi:hypothetical protein
VSGMDWNDCPESNGIGVRNRPERVSGMLRNTQVPIATARSGFTPSQLKDIRGRYSYSQGISAGDVSLFHFLNLGVWLPTAIVSRQGNVGKKGDRFIFCL